MKQRYAHIERHEQKSRDLEPECTGRTTLQEGAFHMKRSQA